MKFAPIVPIPMLDMIESSEYHMCLAGAMYMRQYRDFYMSLYGHSGSKHVILDNGAAEGKMLSDEALLELAALLQPSELVVPDVMHDCYRTVDALRHFYPKVPAPLNLMVVIQGKTWYEINYCLDHALRHNVHSVALPKLLCQHLGSNARLAAAELIRDTNESIPIHCLGCSKRALAEAKDLARQGIVRSIDSASPVVMGLMDEPIAHQEYDWEASHNTIPGWWNKVKTPQVEENLAEFRKWCEETPASGLRELFSERSNSSICTHTTTKVRRNESCHHWRSSRIQRRQNRYPFYWT
jgi:hypothetical protein